MINPTARLRYTALCGVFALILSGCGGGEVAAVQELPVTGLYSLVAVNGAPLPYTYNNEINFKQATAAETLNLLPDGTIVLTTQTRTIVGTFAPTFRTDVSGGTYSRSGKAITITSANWGAQPGTIESGVIAVKRNGTTEYRYQRQ